MTRRYMQQRYLARKRARVCVTCAGANDRLPKVQCSACKLHCKERVIARWLKLQRITLNSDADRLRAVHNHLSRALNFLGEITDPRQRANLLTLAAEIRSHLAQVEEIAREVVA